MTNGTVKVFFKLQQADGYPPVAAESVWASPSEDGDNSLILDNIPFFARDATLGDRVQAPSTEGRRWFLRVDEPSENSLVRAVFFQPSEKSRIELELQALGCSTEYMAQYTLLAISIPATTGVHAVRAVLERETGTGVLDYEEPILRP